MVQAAPGPNIIFVALLGHYIAGAPGAVVATVAIYGPSCVLANAVSQVVERFHEARWRIAIQAGLVPVTIGLIATSALIIARAADHDWTGFAVTAATFAFVYWTRLSRRWWRSRAQPSWAWAASCDLCNEGFRRCPALC